MRRASSGVESMRPSMSRESTDSSKRSMRLPPLSATPSPQTMLNIPLLQHSKASGAGSGLASLSRAESGPDMIGRSSLTFAGTGGLKSRRRSGHGEEKLAPLRRSLDSAPPFDSKDVVQRTLGPSLPPKLLQAPRAQIDIASAQLDERKPDSPAVASPARANRLPEKARRPQRSSIDVPRSVSSPLLVRNETPVGASAPEPVAPNATSSSNTADTDVPGVVSDSSATPANASSAAHAAKCQAVANLQKLFFEEVARGGDPNAAAATALLRLTEESRPGGLGGTRALPSRCTAANAPAESRCGFAGTAEFADASPNSSQHVSASVRIQ